MRDHRPVCGGPGGGGELRGAELGWATCSAPACLPACCKLVHRAARPPALPYCSPCPWSPPSALPQKLEWKRQEETTDAFGNTIKIKAPKKELSRKEKKARAKANAARRARGEEVSDDEEDWE